MSGLRFSSKESIDIFSQDFSNQRSPVIKDDSSEFSFDPSCEPMLQNNPDRFVTFPIVDNDIWLFYKKRLTLFWIAEQVDLSKDYEDLKYLTDEELYFIFRALTLLSSGAGIVNEKIAGEFLQEIQSTEARYVYGFQIAVQHIHSEMYSLLIDTYIKDNTECIKLFREIEHIPCVAKKTAWGLKWMDRTRVPYNIRLVAFAAAQGIFFSATFAALNWLKARGIMPGLAYSNELIRNDESLNKDFAVLMFSKLSAKPSESIIQEIITSAVDIEKEFLMEAVPVMLIGMDEIKTCEYVKYVADRLATALGCSKIYNKENPFDFMHDVPILANVDAVNQSAGKYHGLGAMTKKEDHVFKLDTEF